MELYKIDRFDYSLDSYIFRHGVSTKPKDTEFSNLPYWYIFRLSALTELRNIKSSTLFLVFKNKNPCKNKTWSISFTLIDGMKRIIIPSWCLYQRSYKKKGDRKFTTLSFYPAPFISYKSQKSRFDGGDLPFFFNPTSF